MTGVLIQKEKRHISTQKHTHRECHVSTKMEIKAMCPHTKECQRLPAKHQKSSERQGTDSPSEFSERPHPISPLNLDFQPLELWDTKLLWFMPPVPWLVTFCSYNPSKLIHGSLVVSLSEDTAFSSETWPNAPLYPPLDTSRKPGVYSFLQIHMSGTE